MGLVFGRCSSLVRWRGSHGSSRAAGTKTARGRCRFAHGQMSVQNRIMPIEVANATGPGWNDLPRLFRATADEIEARRVDFDMILDVTVEERARGDEPFWVMTVTTADDDGLVTV